MVAVDDLLLGARRLAADPGLTALPGGRHPGVGTANMIIPLGGEYLELIAVVDEAEAASLGRSRSIGEAVAAGRTFAGWAVRTGDIDALARQLDSRGIATEGPAAGSRRRPDGVLLRWRSLRPARPEAADPFFIEWSVAPGDHPAAQATEHPAGAGTIVAIVAGGAPTQLGTMLVEAGLPLRFEPRREPGLVAVELALPGGRWTLT